ncbi:MAG: hypothetical protein ACI9FU_001318, partial [Granulosicoccus sp.]
FSGGETGGHIEKFNWEGDLVWDYAYSNGPIMQHHDFAVMPNGNLIVLAWEYRTEQEAIAAGRDPNIVEESLWFSNVSEIELVGSDTFNVVWEWSLYDHLVQDIDSTKANFGVISQEKGRLNINDLASEGNPMNPDFMHCNAVTYNADLDQIAISARSRSEIYVIDHSTTTAQAATSVGGVYGKGGDFLYRWGNPQVYHQGTELDRVLHLQHDVTWVVGHDGAMGRFICFNNYGVSETQSSVVEWIPPMSGPGVYVDEPNAAFGPSELSWSYTDSEMYSGQMSGAQRLPNGNTLIVEGNTGEFTEVDSAGTMVWRYINPDSFFGMTTQGVAPNFNSVFKAQRYGTDYAAFDGRDLEAGNVLELDPYPSNCVIYPEEVDSVPPDTITSVLVADINEYTLIHSLGQIRVKMSEPQPVKWQLIDMFGKAMRLGSDQGEFSILTSNLASGYYFIRLTATRSFEVEVQKVFIQRD